MSEENVEVVRRVAEAWQRDDFEGFLCLMDRQIEWLTGRERARGSTAYHGHEGVRELWNHWGIESYVREVSDDGEAYRVAGQDFREVGEDVVLVLRRIDGREAGSGGLVDAAMGQIFEFRDGDIVRVRAYLDHGEDLKGAELER